MNRGYKSLQKKIKATKSAKSTKSTLKKKIGVKSAQLYRFGTIAGTKYQIGISTDTIVKQKIVRFIKSYDTE